jgi:hypothetical protein
MENQIAPALTAEEWNEKSGPRGGYVSFKNEIVDCSGADFEGPFAPAIMALANDSLPSDSPYKITHADADELLVAADNLDSDNMVDAEWRKMCDYLTNLSAKLRAILPPSPP